MAIFGHEISSLASLTVQTWDMQFAIMRALSPVVGGDAPPLIMYYALQTSVVEIHCFGKAAKICMCIVHVGLVVLHVQARSLTCFWTPELSLDVLVIAPVVRILLLHACTMRASLTDPGCRTRRTDLP